MAHGNEMLLLLLLLMGYSILTTNLDSGKPLRLSPMIPPAGIHILCKSLLLCGSGSRDLILINKYDKEQLLSQEESCFLFFFLFFSLTYLYDKTDISWTYSVNHFTIYLSQNIMLYTLNVNSDVCWLFVNKIGKKRIKERMGYCERQWLPPCWHFLALSLACAAEARCLLWDVLRGGPWDNVLREASSQQLMRYWVLSSKGPTEQNPATSTWVT